MTVISNIIGTIVAVTLGGAALLFFAALFQIMIEHG